MYEIQMKGPVDVWTMGYSGFKLEKKQMYVQEGVWYEFTTWNNKFTRYSYPVYLTEQDALEACIFVNKVELSNAIDRYQKNITNSIARLEELKKDPWDGMELNVPTEPIEPERFY